MTDTVFILNGPNLNLLGTREPEIYGSDTLADIEARCADRAAELGLAIDFRQSNHEGVLVDWLHEAHAMGAVAVIVNPAAYTHTSIALLDAAKAIDPPVIEVHLSDPESREAFRHESFIGMAAMRTIKGHGAQGYLMALDAVTQINR
ncbi:type II 3-dehydroquinate dehydratase [Qipengyuania sp. JC766]|uniref:type II 3-dehydroquinate dehydratase n=1 Tax=Qipengyuania sp. JC766 TaxID=3232139 RepID=UPI0034587DF2